ncbi:MAG: FecR/PupR family sigma factor regulator [Alcaligenes sp.]
MDEKTNPPCPDDATWSTAWAWVQRQHDVGFDNQEFNAELRIWLHADPANRAAYDKAAKIWAVAGLVAPRNNLALPPDSGDPTRE